MDMNSNINIPLGLGMALSQNLDAMQYFSALPEDRKREIIDGTHTIRSKKEMHSYVQSLVTRFQVFF